MDFTQLGLNDDILRALKDAGYETPTPIQAQAIPVVLMGRDVMGVAQTGTGKTASFTLPMIEILSRGRAKARMPRSIIIEPTRELAAQVAENFDMYGKYLNLSKALLIGGVSLTEQMRIVDRGVDVLVATPGRLLDMFERGGLLLSDVKILVIDEADRMLDMGFIPDVERIVSLVPKLRQTLFFAATMAPEIRRLSETFLMNPKEISVAPPATPAENVTQRQVLVPKPDSNRPGAVQKEKRALLRSLVEKNDVDSAIIFCNRKRDVGVVCRSLNRHGFNAAQLHGDMSQSDRMDTLTKFKAGDVKLLVCSDVAARGLDIPSVNFVFNFDVPTHAEDYVHRIGRTGRAGRSGASFTLTTPEDNRYMRAIGKLIGGPIPKMEQSDNAPTETIRADEAGQEAEAPKEASAEVAKDEAKPKRPRRQRTSKAKDKAQDKPVEPQETKAPTQKAQPKQEKRSRREKREPRDDQPVLGLGDHVPAFLLREALPIKEK